MLTADGCRDRRSRVFARLAGRLRGPLVLADPINLRYLANFHVDPFSLGADFGGLLVIRPDGHATIYHDKRLPESVQQAHVDERVIVPWYDGITAGQGPRRLVLRAAVEANGGRIHDGLADPLCPVVLETIGELRRRKDPDEIATLTACMRATEAGQAWARSNMRPGMTELDIYLGVFAACAQAAGKPSIVYGDFAVSPGMSRRGGPPTDRRLAVGDMLILDYSVILSGYRSDFTNTLVVGGQPTVAQTRLFETCVAAMAAGEARLRAGETCLAVYEAVRGRFAANELADAFPHHAGHGLGISHPEAPFFVRQSSETLVAGDVVTLEPGAYVDGVGGIRIEHNYLVTPTGFERLSNHAIALS
jgi:Xaa-Pro dipeptidase